MTEEKANFAKDMGRFLRRCVDHSLAERDHRAALEKAAPGQGEQLLNIERAVAAAARLPPPERAHMLGRIVGTVFAATFPAYLAAGVGRIGTLAAVEEAVSLLEERAEVAAQVADKTAEINAKLDAKQAEVHAEIDAKVAAKATSATSAAVAKLQADAKIAAERADVAEAAKLPPMPSLGHLRDQSATVAEQTRRVEGPRHFVAELAEALMAEIPRHLPEFERGVREAARAALPDET